MIEIEKPNITTTEVSEDGSKVVGKLKHILATYSYRES